MSRENLSKWHNFTFADSWSHRVKEANMWNKSPLPLSPLTFTLLARSRLNGTMEQHYHRLILVILSPRGRSPVPVVCKCRSTALWLSLPVVCLDEELQSRWIIDSGTWTCLWVLRMCLRQVVSFMVTDSLLSKSASWCYSVAFHPLVFMPILKFSS